MVVARAIAQRPTSRLLARVAVAEPVVIEVELTAFGEPVEPAIGLVASTPAKALIVPAAASALENVQVQALDPVSADPAMWRYTYWAMGVETASDRTRVQPAG